MIDNIINEIRRMNRSCYDEHGNISRGTNICLDANSEARLAAYLIFDLINNKEYLDLKLLSRRSTVHQSDVYDILENGIRHLDLTILGMKLIFDCESLCIEDVDGKAIGEKR